MATATAAILACCACRQVDKEQQKLELLQVRGDLQSLEQEKAAQAAEAHKRALKQQLDVQTQMMAHMHLKNAEKEEKLHAAQLAVQSEQRYMQRVSAAEEQVAPQAFYGRKKVEWFH
jgi:esterase/lipase